MSCGHCVERLSMSGHSFLMENFTLTIFLELTLTLRIPWKWYQSLRNKKKTIRVLVSHSAPVLWESQDTWPLPLFAPWAIDCWSDAAGGTRQSPWHGVGSVTPFWWADAPSGRKIISGADAGRNRSLDRVMNALELLGPLLTLAAGFEWCRFAAVRIWVDNSAAIHIWKKGYSTACP